MTWRVAKMPRCSCSWRSGAPPWVSRRPSRRCRSEFDPETASVDDVLVSRVLVWGETIGTLTKNEILDADLVLDWIWVAECGPAWARRPSSFAKSAVLPELYENFEALASKQGS